MIRMPDSDIAPHSTESLKIKKVNAVDTTLLRPLGKEKNVDKSLTCLSGNETQIES